jgi:hypothetical protein
MFNQCDVVSQVGIVDYGCGNVKSIVNLMYRVDGGQFFAMFLMLSGVPAGLYLLAWASSII